MCVQGVDYIYIIFGWSPHNNSVRISELHVPVTIIVSANVRYTNKQA